MSLPRPVAVLVCALAVAAPALIPTASPAKTHRTACSTTGAHARHAGSTCNRKGKSKPSARSHHAAKPHRGRHSAKGKVRVRGTSSPGAPVVTPATCEDETVPAASPTGGFSCDDGSTPGCEGEAAPRPAAGARLLVCPVSKGGEGAEAEPGQEMACEEGSGTLCVSLSQASAEGVCADGQAVALCMPAAAGEE